MFFIKTVGGANPSSFFVSGTLTPLFCYQIRTHSLLSTSGDYRKNGAEPTTCQDRVGGRNSAAERTAGGELYLFLHM